MIDDTRLTQIASTLLRLCRAISGPGYDAEELAQVAALAILEKDAADPAFSANPDAYIVRAGIWAARDFIRSGQTSANRQVNNNNYDVIPSAKADPERIVERRETLKDLVAAVEQLSPESRVVVSMIYAGHPKGEIAAALGVSPSAISHRRAVIARKISSSLDA